MRFDLIRLSIPIPTTQIVCELKIQRKVDFHDNIIRCHGITKFESENQIGNNYMMGSSIVTCIPAIY
ncbi:unnamed protein product [Rhizophagus irregularis]|nr:unnamed protein product [Rhizophagus irregularis]